MPAATVATKSPAAEQPSRRVWPWILVLVLLAAAGGGGWWWWQGQQAVAEEAAPARPTRLPAQYVAIEPSFVVNLADPGGNRYLQADVQVVSRDQATIDAVHAHLPSVRNRLLLLFGQQESARLAQRSGKERLQDTAREEVRALLRSEGAPDKVEAVIFTSLVTQ